EIEREALKKETDAASKERLAKLEAALKELHAESAALRAPWEAEKSGIGTPRALQKEIEGTKQALEKAEREYDLNKVAELKYGKLPELERKLAAEEAGSHEAKGKKRLLKEEVDEEDIAEVVSRWTGIPVSKLVEGEREKLVHLADQL